MRFDKKNALLWWKKFSKPRGALELEGPGEQNSSTVTLQPTIQYCWTVAEFEFTCQIGDLNPKCAADTEKLEETKNQLKTLV